MHRDGAPGISVGANRLPGGAVLCLRKGYIKAQHFTIIINTINMNYKLRCWQDAFDYYYYYYYAEYTDSKVSHSDAKTKNDRESLA